ncbi:MAG: type II secretion system F family protein [Bacillota bacterium]
MLLIIVVLVFGAVFLIGKAAADGVARQEESLNDRILTVAGYKVPKNFRQLELSKTFFERIVKPLIAKLSVLFTGKAFIRQHQRLQETLLQAGSPGRLNPGEILTLKFILLMALPLALFFFITTSKGVMFKWLFIIFFAVIGWILPDLYLNNLKQKRMASIQKDLPDTLDLLTVSVEAGLGFDAAMAKVVNKFENHLSREFGRALQEIMVGQPRREALRQINPRTGVEDLQIFINSVIQADQLGIGIANVLRQQSDAIRTRRRQRIEEQAMKAPVKMLLPLVFFIFPSIFIVLLGPAVIQIIEGLSK